MTKGKRQAEGFRMNSSSMRSIKQKRVFLNIAKRAKLIVDERNNAARDEIQNEINNAIKSQHSLFDKNAKHIRSSKDLKTLRESVDSLNVRITEITEKNVHLNSQEITELKKHIRNVKKRISNLKSKKSEK
jgi:hypothetical protein